MVLVKIKNNYQIFFYFSKVAMDEREIIIIILTFLVLLHTIIGFASVAAMLSFFFSKNIPYVDSLALLSVISFLICKQCLSIDIYDYFKGSLGIEELPDYAKDNFFRKKIHNFNGTQSIDYTHLRLDKLDNLEPLKTCIDPDKYQLFFNRKVQYIIFNTVLTLILAIKYNKKEYLPLFLIWVFMTFPA